MSLRSILVAFALVTVAAEVPSANTLLREQVAACKESQWDASRKDCMDLTLWDTSEVSDMSRLFEGEEKFNLDISRWNTSHVTSMAYMFSVDNNGGTAFNADLSRWDTSRVTDAQRMFRRQRVFNADLSRWNVSSLRDIQYLFFGAYAFNSDISKWDTSRLTTMEGTFWGASAFNIDIGRWNTSGVQTMRGTMAWTESFNADISRWDVSKVNHMGLLFAYSAFQGNLAAWDTGRVESMFSMFGGSSRFNGDISRWDLRSATQTAWMFTHATSFNGDLSKWDVSRVTTMRKMFEQAHAFNTDISAWQTSSLQNAEEMFFGAVTFNKDISRWNVSNVSTCRAMFATAKSFNIDLSAWDLSNCPENQVDSMFVGNPKLSLQDVDECLGSGDWKPSPCPQCPAGPPGCTNFDGGPGSVSCYCTKYPLGTRCDPSEMTLRYNSSDLVSCAALGAHCSRWSAGAPHGGSRRAHGYTCLADTRPGPVCDREFQGLERLCSEHEIAVLPAALEDFVVADQYAISDEAKVLSMMRDFNLDPERLSLPLWMRVELAEAGETNSTAWVCGGEPDEAFLEIGSGSWHEFLPMLYLGVSTLLTVAADGLINLREALEVLDTKRISLMVLGVALEVAGSIVLVNGIDRVAVGTGHCLTGRCTVSGVYDGIDFELSQRCGGLETTQRVGIEAAPVCRETTVVPLLALYIGLVDLLYKVGIVVLYRQHLQNAIRSFWGKVHESRTGTASGSDRPATADGSAGHLDGAACKLRSAASTDSAAAPCELQHQPRGPARLGRSSDEDQAASASAAHAPAIDRDRRRLSTASLQSERSTRGLLEAAAGDQVLAEDPGMEQLGLAAVVLGSDLPVAPATARPPVLEMLPPDMVTFRRNSRAGYSLRRFPLGPSPAESTLGSSVEVESRAADGRRRVSIVSATLGHSSRALHEQDPAHATTLPDGVEAATQPRDHRGCDDADSLSPGSELPPAGAAGGSGPRTTPDETRQAPSDLEAATPSTAAESPRA